jgi:hypothetical protein
MRSQFESGERYLEYLAGKMTDLEDRKRRAWQELHAMEEELMVLDAESVETIKRLREFTV